MISDIQFPKINFTTACIIKDACNVIAKVSTVACAVFLMKELIFTQSAVSLVKGAIWFLGFYWLQGKLDQPINPSLFA